MSKAAAWSKSCSISLQFAPRRSTAAPNVSSCTTTMPASTDKVKSGSAWTEAVTKISDGHVPDEVYDEARQYFSDKELVDLTGAVIAINAWNRAAIAFRATPPLKTAKLAA